MGARFRARSVVMACLFGVAAEASCGGSSVTRSNGDGDRGGDAGEGNGTSGGSGQGGASGSGRGGASGTAGSSSGRGGTGGATDQGGTTGADGGATDTGGEGGEAGVPSAGMGGIGNGAGMSGAGGLNGGGAGTGGVAGFGGFSGECFATPARLFPVAPVTGQAAGLTGNANPPGAMGSFDGHLVYTPCMPADCADCPTQGWVYQGVTTSCPTMGRSDFTQNFMVGGTPGQVYRVTLRFYGIVEPKNYGILVTRESGRTRPQNLDTGADPPPFAYAEGNPTHQMSDYNSYELHVVDHQGFERCSYYLNADTQEGHWTYVLNFERTIEVIGGGRIRVRLSDRNCRMIKNCTVPPFCDTGSPPSTSCATSTRTVDIPPTAVPQPNGLVQPGLGAGDANSGQWLFIDVTNVLCLASALGCDGI